MAVWYFTAKELHRTPSWVDGMSAEDEARNRAKGVNFIFAIAMRLKLPQITMSTAAVYFHRFYMKFSLRRYPYFDIAATCLFLATKVEESVRRLRDIITIAARLAQKNMSLVIDEQSREYWRWRDTILYTEELVLEALCFDLSIRHPYQEAVSLVSKFAPGQRHVAKRAWAFINDMLRSTICLQYKPRIIAAAAFYMALKRSGIDVNSGDAEQWYKTVDAKFDDIAELLETLFVQYRRLPSDSGASLIRHVFGDETPLASGGEEAGNLKRPLEAASSGANDKSRPEPEKKIKIEDYKLARANKSTQPSDDTQRHK